MNYREIVKDTGPCAKAVVTCTLITPEGARYIGQNWCLNPQETCPREPGEGYAKCSTICQQLGHAEQEAIKVAGKHAKGATAELGGHTYYCMQCQHALFDAGVVSLARAK